MLLKKKKEIENELQKYYFFVQLMEGILQCRNTSSSFTFSKAKKWKLIDNILSSEIDGQEPQQIFFIIDINSIALHKSKPNQFAMKYSFQNHQSIIEFVAPTNELAKEWVENIIKSKQVIISSQTTNKSNEQKESDTSSISNSKFKIQMDSETQKVVLLPN